MPDVLWMLRISWPTAFLISGWLGPMLVNVYLALSGRTIWTFVWDFGFIWTVQAAVIYFLVRLCRWLVGATRRG